MLTRLRGCWTQALISTLGTRCPISYLFTHWLWQALLLYGFSVVGSLYMCLEILFLSVAVLITFKVFTWYISEVNFSDKIILESGRMFISVYLWYIVFSERELTFTFAICCRPSVCLSSVCNARAPYPGGSNFRQYFYAIRYLGHPLTSTENLTEIVPGEPLQGS